MYYAYFHSIIKYGIIFSGNSSSSGKIFTWQKKITRIVASAQPRTSCRSLVKQLEILAFPCEYLLFINELHYQKSGNFSNSSLYNINTRNKHHLRRPNANLACFQKSTFYAGINFSTRPVYCDNPQELWAIISISLKKIPTHTLLLLCRWILYVLRWFIFFL